ncbi:MAG: type II toxin-antitoxin system VapB family antitoxin [Spirochaetales bacterium]
MAISIRNKRAEELAREAAQATGKSMTDIIIEALEDKLASLRRPPGGDAALSRVMEIAKRCAQLPTIDTRPEDVILGYEESGFPGGN